MTIFNITPIGKPRMTQRDKWANVRTAAASKYFVWKDDIRRQAKEKKFTLGKQTDLVFLIPMPASWSQKKKDIMRGVSHEARPDRDNLEKAFFDALLSEDCTNWKGTSEKYWWDYGAIIVTRNSFESGVFDSSLLNGNSGTRFVKKKITTSRGTTRIITVSEQV